jgi:hypothetical protein
MPGLDALGAGPPDAVGRRLLEQARPYASRHQPVLPMFELIATVAHPVPGRDGTYRTRQRDEVVRRYLEAARRFEALLVLDLQPGRSDFLAELRYWERYLREPDVGVALDPEFSMGPGEVPGKRLGHTDAASVNRASAYLSGIVRRYGLPEKLFVVHQFQADMITDKARIELRRGLAMVWNADGFGGRRAKLDDYADYAADRRFHPGLKLFYRLDTELMRPSEVLRLEPAPQVVDYQ